MAFDIHHNTSAVAVYISMLSVYLKGRGAKLCFCKRGVYCSFYMPNIPGEYTNAISIKNDLNFIEFMSYAITM